MLRSKSFPSMDWNIQALDHLESNQVIRITKGSSNRDSLKIVEKELFDEEVQEYQNASYCSYLSEAPYIASNDSSSSVISYSRNADDQVAINEVEYIENGQGNFLEILEDEQKRHEDYQKKTRGQFDKLESYTRKFYKWKEKISGFG